MSKKKKKNPSRNKNNDVIEGTDIKKEVVLGEENKSNRVYIIAVTLIAIASGVIYFLNKGRDSRKTFQTRINQPVNLQKQSSFSTERNSITKKILSYDISIFSDGKAKYFQYRYGNLNIRYFILKSSDGVIRAAFDACDVCWPAGKGYYQKDDKMICRNCGKRFASRLVNEIRGGCNPAPLNRKIVDGRVVINVTDIIRGAGYFNFTGRS